MLENSHCKRLKTRGKGRKRGRNREEEGGRKRVRKGGEQAFIVGKELWRGFAEETQDVSLGQGTIFLSSPCHECNWKETFPLSPDKGVLLIYSFSSASAW